MLTEGRLRKLIRRITITTAGVIAVLTVNAQRQIHRIVPTRTHLLQLSRTPNLERERSSTTTMIAQSMALVTSGANVTKINMVTILGPAVLILTLHTSPPQAFNSLLRLEMLHCLRHLHHKFTFNNEPTRTQQATYQHPNRTGRVRRGPQVSH